MIQIKFLQKALLVVILIFLSATTSSAMEVAHPQQEALVSELELMLTQPRDAFVVVQIAGTDDFIQFYGEAATLFLDLPAVALTVEENKRADAFFGKNDVPQITDVAIDPETGEDFTLIVWRQTFANGQAAAVAELSLRALRAIYLAPPNSKLEFFRGWE